MTRYGYFLSCEEYAPGELIRQARLAEEAGFDALWISDVSEDMISAPCGPDVDTHLTAVREFAEAGFDEVYIGQVGGNAKGFFEFYGQQVLPRLRATD